MKLKFAAAFSDTDEARRLAEAESGTLFMDQREDTGHLPFAALVTGSSDRLEPWLSADVGTFLIAERIVKPRATEGSGELPGAIGLFTMVANPALGPVASDTHWRENHAPLALSIHEAMTNYRQLCVVHSFNGPEWHGFALCGFDNESDLRTRFYNSDEGRKAIEKDVATFADTRKSPRRLIVTETRFD